MVRCNVRKLMTVPVLMMLAAPAAAQDVVYRFEQRGVPPAPGDVFTLPVPPPPGAGGMLESRIGLLAVEPFEGADPVVGAPYSAEISTDVVQALADGNRIEHHTTGSVARDGQGRVRRDQQLAAIGGILPQVDGRIVTINDPVAHIHYSLDPVRKHAMQMPLPVMKGLVPPAPPRPALPAESKGGRVESLGTSDIEGVQAQGTRTTITIPAGAIGNQAPIEMVSEQWFSPELGTIVMSRRSDPRFGDTTYRLQNIVRAEPAADLFQIPSDYAVDAAPAFGKATTFIARPPSPPPVP